MADKPSTFSTDKSVSEVSRDATCGIEAQAFAAAENDTPDGQASLPRRPTSTVSTLRIKNVADAHLVSKMQAQLSEVTVPVDAASQYGATIYIRDPQHRVSTGALSLSYMKGGVQVNTSSSDLDVNSPSHPERHTLKVPVTDINYMADEWARSASRPDRYYFRPPNLPTPSI